MTHLSRRFVLTGLATAVAVSRLPSVALAQAAGPFKLPPLPYAANALEPHIDARTMEIHHDRHHAAYVNNMNGFAKDNPMLGQRPIVEILAKLSDVPEAVRTGVRNNLGGHANHSMFWEIMGPGGGKPDGELATAITRDLGGMEKFQNDFNGAGGRRVRLRMGVRHRDPRTASSPSNRSPTRTRRSWTASAC